MTKKGDKPRAYKKAPKNKGGRPLKLTHDVILKISENLKHGAYIETAVVCAGVPKATFYLWMKIANQKPKSIYAKLLDAVEKAQAESEAKDLMLISKHAHKNWNAAAWRLERKNPQRWAATHRPPVQNATNESESGFVLAYSLDDDDDEKGDTEK